MHGGLRRQFDLSSQGDQMHKLQNIFLHLDIQDVSFACNGSCYIWIFKIQGVFYYSNKRILSARSHVEPRKGPGCLICSINLSADTNCVWHACTASAIEFTALVYCFRSLFF